MADLSIIETKIIRTPASGPEPCNTLVFLQCRVPGIDVPVQNDERVSSRIRFQTEFRIDGYLQSKYDWYKHNTLISATASLKALNTTTDLSFMMATEYVEPILQQLDGSLAFDVGLAAWFQDDSWFDRNELALTATLTAYVLCYEPREERPATGIQRTPWSIAATESIKISELLGKRTKHLKRPAGRTQNAEGCDC